MLVGEGAMRDHAVGPKVDLVIGESSQVRIDVENFVPPKNRQHHYRITVTNANPPPPDAELGFQVDASRSEERREGKTRRRPCRFRWSPLYSNTQSGQLARITYQPSNHT